MSEKKQKSAAPAARACFTFSTDYEKCLKKEITKHNFDVCIWTIIK